MNDFLKLIEVNERGGAGKRSYVAGEEHFPGVLDVITTQENREIL